MSINNINKIIFILFIQTFCNCLTEMIGVWKAIPKSDNLDGLLKLKNYDEIIQIFQFF